MLEKNQICKKSSGHSVRLRRSRRHLPLASHNLLHAFSFGAPPVMCAPLQHIFLFYNVCRSHSPPSPHCPLHAHTVPHNRRARNGKLKIVLHTLANSHVAGPRGYATFHSSNLIIEPAIERTFFASNAVSVDGFLVDGICASANTH